MLAGVVVVGPEIGSEVAPAGKQQEQTELVPLLAGHQKVDQLDSVLLAVVVGDKQVLVAGCPGLDGSGYRRREACASAGVAAPTAYAAGDLGLGSRLGSVHSTCANPNLVFAA